MSFCPMDILFKAVTDKMTLKEIFKLLFYKIFVTFLEMS